MADAKQPIIIKKKKGGGGHGHHGGAWKVAYADFVTAMMAFFLVMWLMGSDEETKASISHYFNNPSTPWKEGRDPDSNSVHPMGEKNGAGDSILNGQEGLYPEDIIREPIKNIQDTAAENKQMAFMIEDLMSGDAHDMKFDEKKLQFSLPEQVLFKPGSDELEQESYKHLKLLGDLLKNYSGYITIEGHTDSIPVKNEKFKNNWDLAYARARAVMKYFVDKHGMDESKLYPVAYADRRPASAGKTIEGQKKNRRVEFRLTQKAPTEEVEN
jgi:chemotaxis protein MotB